MTSKTKIILMSHGFMAKETLNSATMIVGARENVSVVSMLAEDGLSGTTEKLTKELNKYEDNDSILIIADLKGGTPCNVAMMKMAEYSNLRVITGLNLAMTIEALMSQIENIDKLVDYLTTIGKEAVSKIELDLIDDEVEYEED